MINLKRLAETFKFFVGIDSVSREEGALSKELERILISLGAETFVDDAGQCIGGNTGNLIAKFKGSTKAPPLMLNAHMDTVEPGKNVSVIFKNETFTSDGTTILGADDKSAIAVLLEVMRVLTENKMQHCPIELVFTICEEIGLLGAKNLDISLISAKYGYALDSSDTEAIVTRTPAANRLEFTIHGKDAHAGSAPENGINAISIACRAISELDMGRIDYETTANIGVIRGGVATNIVPNLVEVKGEVRSHNDGKLSMVTDNIVASFQNVVKNYNSSSLENSIPRLEKSIKKEFSLTNIPDDHFIVTLAQKAAFNLRKKMTTKTTGGASDANIFFSKGIITGVLGTGMNDVHTLRENIRLEDMAYAANLLLEIIKLHSY
ncbi:MAG TPA: M20/M25/M40 family metallo-hydrolase [Desulfobacteraceae bacterium]|nr:M20/M25/M40 family metallo-hydrolase [Desulfobacteraceae bacterium]